MSRVYLHVLSGGTCPRSSHQLTGDLQWLGASLIVKARHQLDLGVETLGVATLLIRYARARERTSARCPHCSVIIYCCSCRLVRHSPSLPQELAHLIRVAFWVCVARGYPLES